MTIKEIHVIEERSSTTPWDEGFFKLRRFQLQNEYTDHQKSRVYACDVLERRGVDAVAVFLWYIKDGEPFVFFRECIRPAVYLRKSRPNGIKDDREYPTLIESIAGIIEPEDEGEEGIRMRATIEAVEEAGFVLSPDSAVILGQGSFDAPGVMAEKVFFVAMPCDPTTRGNPKTDGSPFEERGNVFSLSMREAFEWIKTGKLCDMKTEVGLRRLLAFFLDSNLTDLDYARSIRFGI
jgi:ADP-ribose pyrophosphatase